MTAVLAIRRYSDPTYRHVVAVREHRRQLDRIEDGANINLNHEEFYTVVETEPEGCVGKLDAETGILQHPGDSCPVCPNKAGEGEA